MADAQRRTGAIPGYTVCIRIPLSSYLQSPFMPPVRGNATVNVGAGNRVPRGFLHWKSPSLWPGGHLESRMTAGDSAHPGREAHEGARRRTGVLARQVRSHGHSARRTQRDFRAAVSCLRRSPRPLALAGSPNHGDARRRSEAGGDGARRAGWEPPSEAGGSGAGGHPLDLGRPPRSGVMRRPGSPCAPVRAALVQLRVAHGVKRGRGREEVEAPERRKRCLRVPRALESVGGGGGWPAQPGELPGVPAQLGGRECRAREGGSCGPKCLRDPTTPPLDAQDRGARPGGARSGGEAEEKA